MQAVYGNINNNQEVWDDKFGMVKPNKPLILEKDPHYKGEGFKLRFIDGVGKDAEVITNEAGGKQSKAPMAMHLIDPRFLTAWFNANNIQTDVVIKKITDFMVEETLEPLIDAVFELHNIQSEDTHEDLALSTIAKVLQEGAEKYEVNNWRLIPQEEHINHALIHYLAFKVGDAQDDHLPHCMCRLMMAYATEPSEGFSYTEYVKKTS